MQPMANNQTPFFPRQLTPEHLREIEESIPVARAKLIAHLKRWEETGTIDFPDLQDLEWPAEEPRPLTSTS